MPVNTGIHVLDLCYISTNIVMSILNNFLTFMFWHNIFMFVSTPSPTFWIFACLIATMCCVHLVLSWASSFFQFVCLTHSVNTQCVLGNHPYTSFEVCTGPSFVLSGGFIGLKALSLGLHSMAWLFIFCEKKMFCPTFWELVGDIYQKNNLHPYPSNPEITMLPQGNNVPQG